MKKNCLVFFLVLTFAVAGCRPAQIFHPAAQAYLDAFEIEQSTLLRLNTSRVNRYRYSQEDLSASYSEVFRGVELDWMRPFFDFFPRLPSTPLQKGDYVTVSVEVRDRFGGLLFSEEPFAILVGARCFDQIIEEQLIGCCAGDLLSFSAEESGLYRNLIGTVELTVEKSEKVLPRSDSPECFSFFSEHVQSSYANVKEDEYLREREAFWEYAISCGSFDVLFEEQLRLAEMIVAEARELASWYGLSLEQYCKIILHEENLEAFLEKALDDAENAIKAVMVIGSIAAEQGMDVSEEWNVPGSTETVEGNAYAALAAYLSLERAVVRHYSKSVLPDRPLIK